MQSLTFCNFENNIRVALEKQTFSVGHELIQVEIVENYRKWTNPRDTFFVMHSEKPISAAVPISE